MKKGFLAMLMMSLIMVLTTGCGTRVENAKVYNEVADFSETIETVDEKEIEETTDLDLVTVNMNKAEMQDYQVLVNVPEFISGLEEEPDWSIENFGSIDDFKAFCSTMSIPKVITDIYDEHKANGSLNDRGELEVWGNSDKYAHYGPQFVVYQEEDGTYRISYCFATYNAEDVIGQGCFRNGENLVIISVLTYSNSGTDLEYLPKYYSKFNRDVISSDGQISRTSEYMDTALLSNRNFEKVMVCPEFTVLFYPDTNEFLCVKDSKAIGSRTKVDNVDLEGLNLQGSIDYGILNKLNTLVYPIIVKNNQGTSFELLHVADVSNLATSGSMPIWVKINEICYPVSDGNTIYYVDNATVANYEFSYSSYGYTDNIDWLVSATPIVVNSNEIVVKQYDIDYNDFQQFKLWDGSEGCGIHVRATNKDMEMYGRMSSSTRYCIYNAHQENKFSAYITEDGGYNIPTYSEVQEVLNVLGIDVK